MKIKVRRFASVALILLLSVGVVIFAASLQPSPNRDPQQPPAATTDASQTNQTGATAQPASAPTTFGCAEPTVATADDLGPQ